MDSATAEEVTGEIEAKEMGRQVRQCGSALLTQIDRLVPTADPAGVECLARAYAQVLASLR
jgi:hypothetical protein